MVDDTMNAWSVKRLAKDRVSQRLLAAGAEHAANTFQWLQGEADRKAKRRRLNACVIGGWLLVTFAAFVGSAFAYQMTDFIRSLLEVGLAGSAGSEAVFMMPAVLLFLGFSLLLGGVVAWAMERAPGLHRTTEALDWAAACDAMTRLLAAGCTYSEAFRTSAQEMRTQRIRNWLLESAQEIERGNSELTAGSGKLPDADVLLAMIGRGTAVPAQRWRIAADHFDAQSQRRVAIVVHTVPLVATVLAALLAWTSLASSLGWMWRAVRELTSSLGAG